MPSYQDAIGFLNSFQFHGYKLGLHRIYRALKYFGNPHKRLNFIHVAGTNGKGSVCSTLSSILTRCGYKTGLYTSPHLVRLNERFRLCEREIADEELIHIINEIKNIIQKGFELSYFEITTLMSILWFYEKGCDICVFETGLGGRLDATNIVRPVVSVITSISFDHKRYLGETIEKIAYEKAGILKRGVPAIIGNKNQIALKVIEDRANTLKLDAKFIERDFRLINDDNQLTYCGWNRIIKAIDYNLKGEHQEANLATSIATCEKLMELGFRLSEDNILEGCRSVKWPCRCEILNLKNFTVLIDGAHNLDGVMALSKFLGSYLRERKFQEKILIFGCTDDSQDRPEHSKDIGKMLVMLLKFFDRIYITIPPNARHSITIDRWKSEIDRLGLKDYSINLVEDYEKCYEEVLDGVIEDTFLCICGSLYLCGVLREKLISQT